MVKSLLSLDHEKSFFAKGYRSVIGIDEVGRGAWAGPLVICAFAVIQPDVYKPIPNVNDSKQISKSVRVDIYSQLLTQKAAGEVRVSVGEASAEMITVLGLSKATSITLDNLLTNFDPCSSYFLLDQSLNPTDNKLNYRNYVRGDANIYSIAAASIYAKVYRDSILADLDQKFPGYKFSNNVGYGTAFHRKALAELGPCLEHRLSYKPLRKVILQTKN